MDGGSRWGVKGSVEAGEGLTAVYQFEHKIDAARAGLDNPMGGSHGRLSNIGLSGGFGSLTMGQIWSASYNSFGAVTDNSTVIGNSETTYRHGNALSYAFSNDLMALQTDLIYDSPDPMAPEVGSDGSTAIPANVVSNRTRNREDLQKLEFGLSVNVGEIGKVAFAHIDNKHMLSDTKDVMGKDASDADVLIKAVPQLKAADGTTDITDDVTSWRTKSTYVAGEISVSDLTVYVGSKKTKYINTTTPVTGVSAGAAGDGSLAVKPADKTTFFGFRGGLGDTGVNYLFQWRDVKNSHKPWFLGLYKGLGGGASVFLEHVHNDGNAANDTRAYVRVNF